MQAADNAASTQQSCLCNFLGSAYGLGALFEVSHHMVHCKGDASPQVHGVQPRCHRLAALAHNSPRQDCGRGSACRRVQVLVGCMYLLLGRVQQCEGALQTGSKHSRMLASEACLDWALYSGTARSRQAQLARRVPAKLVTWVHLAACAWHANCRHEDAACCTSLQHSRQTYRPQPHRWWQRQPA